MENSDNSKPPRRGRLFVVTLVCVGAAVATFFFAWPPNAGNSKQEEVPAKKTAIPVDVAKVVRKDVSIVHSGLGVVTPLTSVDIKVRVDGQLQRIAFAEGQEVKAGDVLAQLDPRPYEAAVAQAKAEYEKQLAGLTQAKIDSARTRSMADKHIGSEQTAETAAAQVAMLEAATASAKAALNTAELNLDFATIRAPFDGRAGLLTQDKGAILRTSDTTGIVTLNQMRPIAVEFTLTQDDLPDLVTGRSKGKLAVSVDSRDGGRHLADGELSVIDSQVDSTTGMIKLKAVFANETTQLWPGELVTARINLKTLPKATVVPAAAVLNGQSGPYVFICNPDDTVAFKAVKTAETAGGLTTITEGLSPGDTVVTAGQSRLDDGTKVAARTAKADDVATAETAK